MVARVRRPVARAGQLRRRVVPFQCLDHVPVEMQFPGDILDEGAAAAPAHIEGNALGVKRVVGEKRKTLPLYRAATTAEDTPHLEFPIDAGVAAGQIAYPPKLAVVPT